MHLVHPSPGKGERCGVFIAAQGIKDKDLSCRLPSKAFPPLTGINLASDGVISPISFGRGTAGGWIHQLFPADRSRSSYPQRSTDTRKTCREAL